MKWAIYAIIRKDIKVGKDVYIGHFAYRRGEFRKTLEERLSAHKQQAEERGGDFRLHERMREVGPEGWEIEPLESARSSDEARESERVTRNVLKPDLNEWVRPRD